MDMNYELLVILRKWRDEQARIEGVEGYRILPNAALESVAESLPHDRATLCAIKGIKEAKYRKYGKVLLGIISRFSQENTTDKSEEDLGMMNHELSGADDVKNPLTISQFLDGINIELSGMAARLRGEVSSVDIRERVVYFTLKDTEDESVLSCLIFRSAYELSGVPLSVGDEVIVEGVPEVYKPTGRLSLKVGVIEYAGEGALKKAYDALYQKLEREGVFAPEKKRPLPDFPERIALITSRDGAAIGDFTMNLVHVGFKIDFYSTLVEGKKAILEILEAIQFFNRTPEKYDVLVIIRGGGSLESLQAFNTEVLVRAVKNSRIPVLAGIGHERDVSLVALAADRMVSTPTAVARTLCEPWDEARSLLRHFEEYLPVVLERELSLIGNRLAVLSEGLLSCLRKILERVDFSKKKLLEKLALLQRMVQQKIANLSQTRGALIQDFITKMESVRKETLYAEDLLCQYDPKRVLGLGYSLVRSGQTLVKDARTLKVDDILKIQFSRGSASMRVKKIFDH